MLTLDYHLGSLECYSLIKENFPKVSFTECSFD